jgi:C4-dicarboxylate-specific signal transduction histidine kinase
LLNLVTNALDACLKAARCTGSANGGRRVRIDVDTGSGISADIRAHLRALGNDQPAGRTGPA